MRVCSFEGSTPFGAPDGWDQELDGTVGVVFGVRAVDTLSGRPFVYTVYRPTAEDIAAFQAGGALRLGTMGGMPVVNMAVLGGALCESAGVRDEWDMGPVITGE